MIPQALLLAAALASAVVPARQGATAPPARPGPDRSPGRTASPVPRPARCTQPSGEAVTADSVLADLKAGKDVLLKGRIVQGSLDADEIWPAADERKASLRVVRGRLRLDSCRVEGRVQFARSVFLKGLDLPCTEIRGDLDLTDSALQGGLDASRARILGQARLVRLEATSGVLLTGAVVDERVDLTGARVPETLNLQGGDFKGDVELARSVLGEVDLSGARVGGVTTLGDLLVLSSLSARDSGFAKGLVLESVNVVGRLDLSAVRGAGGVSISDSVVGEDLFFDLAADGPVSVAGLTVGRDLSLFDGKFMAVTIERARIGGTTELEGARFAGKVVIRDSDFGTDFTATDAVFARECEMHRVRLAGEDPLGGAVFKRAPVLVDTYLPRPPTVSEEELEDEEPDDDDEDE